MSQISRFARAAIRFLIALVIAEAVVVAAQFSLLFFGDAYRYSGVVLLVGTVAAVVLAVRFAITGQFTRVDRVVASAATLITAGSLSVVVTMAGLAVVALAALWALFTVSGGADTANSYFGPMIGQASIVLWFAVLGIAGLGYTLYRVWR